MVSYHRQRYGLRAQRRTSLAQKLHVDMANSSSQTCNTRPIASLIKKNVLDKHRLEIKTHLLARRVPVPVYIAGARKDADGRPAPRGPRAKSSPRAPRSGACARAVPPRLPRPTLGMASVSAVGSSISSESTPHLAGRRRAAAGRSGAWALARLARLCRTALASFHLSGGSPSGTLSHCLYFNLHLYQFQRADLSYQHPQALQDPDPKAPPHFSMLAYCGMRLHGARLCTDTVIRRPHTRRGDWCIDGYWMLVQETGDWCIDTIRYTIRVSIHHPCIHTPSVYPYTIRVSIHHPCIDTPSVYRYTIHVSIHHPCIDAIRWSSSHPPVRSGCLDERGTRTRLSRVQALRV